MCQLEFIRIDLDFFNSDKIKFLLSKPNGNEQVLIFINLLLIAGRCNENGDVLVVSGVPHDVDSLCEIIGVEHEFMKNTLNTLWQLKMIEVKDGIITIKNWLTYQDKERQVKVKNNNRKSQIEYRERQKQQSFIDAEDEERIAKAKKYNALFERLWELYPKKVGKGAVSYAKKEKMYNIGYEEMARAIDRFRQQMEYENRPTQYIMDGRRFFTTGFDDYLDKNWKGIETMIQTKNKQESDFEKLLRMANGGIQ